MIRKFSEIALALSLMAILAALPTPVLAGEYKLGISDKVKIKVQEWPDLGKFSIRHRKDARAQSGVDRCRNLRRKHRHPDPKNQRDYGQDRVP